MTRNAATVERFKGGVDRFVNGALDATVHLPLGIYDRTRAQLADVDAKRIRKTFEDLLEDFIDRGQDRIQPLERRLKREGRRAEVADGVTGAKRTTSNVKKTVKKTTRRAQKTTQKTVRKAAARTSPSKLSRAAAPRTASELPIESYASLTADEIVARLTGLTQTDLARVYKYEKAHENRATVLDAVDAKLVDLPIPSYDTLTVDEVAKRLERLDESELKAIKRYETATKMRATLIERIDTLLS